MYASYMPSCHSMSLWWYTESKLNLLDRIPRFGIVVDVAINFLGVGIEDLNHKNTVPVHWQCPPPVKDKSILGEWSMIPYQSLWPCLISTLKKNQYFRAYWGEHWLISHSVRCKYLY